MATVSLEETFTYHAPFGNQPERYQAIREEGLKFSKLGTELAPPSRERSLALTFIQQAVQMLNAAIAIHEKPVFHPVVVDQVDGRPIPLSQAQYDAANKLAPAEPVVISQEQN